MDMKNAFFSAGSFQVSSWAASGTVEGTVDQSAKRGRCLDEIFGAAQILPQMGRPTAGQPKICPKMGHVPTTAQKAPKNNITTEKT